jgi:cyclic 2,3-diphosphoglycerate synthetase
LSRTLAIIDGEHYAPTVRDALAELPYDFVGAYLVGGTEKLRGGEEYGVPVVTSLEAGLELRPELVVDLSDEPVLSPPDRLLLASRVLAAGAAYAGADFRFDPPEFEPFELPSLAVIGTGKRVGKTAVSAHILRTLRERHDVVAVAMGRGGPREPEVVDVRPTVDTLLERSRAGHHAASDYLELAALTGVVTVGCRRAGGGLAGAVGTSNVLEGARVAASLRPELVVFDGSGAAIPPVDVDARVCVVGRGHDATSYLNAYRVLVSDLVVATEPVDAAPIRRLKSVPVVQVELRLSPLEPLNGRRVAVFTAGDVPTDKLDGEVVHVSRSLSDRSRLREELERVDADVYLVELKAAAIDVVAEEASRKGVEVVLAANEVVSVDGGDLDDEIERLVDVGVAA